jgi:heavy metal sensor kinase
VAAGLPLRVRLTLAFALSMAVVLTSTGLFLYLQLESELTRSIDTGLRARAEAVAAGIGEQGIAFDAQDSQGSRESLTQILDQAGRIVESSSPAAPPPLSPSNSTSLTKPAFFTRRGTDDGDNVRAYALPVREGKERYLIVVGSSLEEKEETLGQLLVVLLSAGPAATLVASTAGWFLAGAALRPVERMREEAEAISISERERRLPVPRTRDEMARLGTTLNAMLDRMQEAFERERRFVDEASHELRTPLALLKGELELALSRSRSAEELEHAIRNASFETDRLVRLAEDLLVLARANRGQILVRRSEVDLAQVLEEAAASFQRTATDDGIDLRVESAAQVVSIDPERIRQAVGNLIDNSLRYTSRGGTIWIRGTVTAHAIHIDVKDNGRGFPPEFLDRAFEPFARPLEESGLDTGAGLGLAIVEATARAHDGTAVAANLTVGGAKVSMILAKREAS